MKGIVSSIIVLLVAVLFLLGGRAISAQDKYTVVGSNVASVVFRCRSVPTCWD
jgi:hypothetical protein